MEILIYRKEYEQGVIDLILPIQQAEFAVPVTIADQPDLQNVKGFYQQGKGNFWIAVDDNKVIGTIALIDIGNRQVALRKMFVDVHYRGKTFGVAQRLMETVIEWCKEEGIDEIYLGTINIMEAARKFYLKNGFVELVKEMLPASFPLMKVDNRFFKRTVDIRE